MLDELEDLQNQLFGSNNEDDDADKASNPDTSSEELSILSKSKDENIRQSVAENPNTDQETLEKLSNDKDYYVKLSVASNKNCNTELLSSLAEDENENIRSAVGKNINCSSDTLKKLAEDEDKNVVESALHNLFTKNENLISDYLDSENDTVLMSIASFNKTDPEILKKLISSDDKNIIKTVIKNPNVEQAIIDTLYESLKNKGEIFETDDAFGSFMDTLVYSIASYSSNPKIITELSTHQSYEIREALVLNPNTNLDLLEKFLNDDSPTVVIETVSQILNRDKPKEKLKALLVKITEIKEFKNSTEDPAYYTERAAEKLKELD